MPKNYFMFADLEFEHAHDKYLEKIAERFLGEDDNYASMLEQDQEAENQDENN